MQYNTILYRIPSSKSRNYVYNNLFGKVIKHRSTIISRSLDKTEERWKWLKMTDGNELFS